MFGVSVTEALWVTPRWQMRRRNESTVQTRGGKDEKIFIDCNMTAMCKTQLEEREEQQRMEESILWTSTRRIDNNNNK